MEGYQDIKTTISIDVEFRVDTFSVKSEAALINLILTKKEELDAEVRKALRKMDCTIFD